jgi:hypothetical protein
MLPVFRSHAHQPFAVAARFFRTEGSLPIEIAHVGHQFAPLAGQQIDDVDAFGGAFELGGGR